MQIILISGFLGAGKTTLLQRILSENASMKRTAIIVNEFGEVGVDGQILRSQSMDVIEITDGCLCCSLRGSLTAALDELLEFRADQLDRIIIEASGVANTRDLIASLQTHAAGRNWQVGPFISVVDASRYIELDKMLGEFLEHQVRSADVLVLNKADLTSAEVGAEVEARVSALNAQAKIVAAERCMVNVADLLADTGARTIKEIPALPSEPHHHHHVGVGVTTVTLTLPEGSNRERFKQALSSLPSSVWRAKGFVILDGQAYLAQYASGVLELEVTGTTTDNKLVFIGDDLNSIELARTLSMNGEPLAMS